MTKKKRLCKKYGMFPPKTAESDTISLVQGLCGSGGSIYNKDASQNTLSACTHNNRSRNYKKSIQVGLKLYKSQISQKYPSRICFITPGWKVTHDINLLFLTVGVGLNSNVTSNKSVWKTIMILKTNQQQIKTYHPQANSIIERVHTIMYPQWHAQIIWLEK
jgi:hypothetical protein